MRLTISRLFRGRKIEKGILSPFDCLIPFLEVFGAEVFGTDFYLRLAAAIADTAEIDSMSSAKQAVRAFAIVALAVPILKDACRCHCHVPFYLIKKIDLIKEKTI